MSRTALLESDFFEAIKVAKEIVTVHHKAKDKEREGFALASLAQHLLRHYVSQQHFVKIYQNVMRISMNVGLSKDFVNAQKVAISADFIFKSIHEKEGVKMAQKLKDISTTAVLDSFGPARRQRSMALKQVTSRKPSLNARTAKKRHPP